MNLLIDAGNTLTKIGIAENGKIIFTKALNPSEPGIFESLLSSYPSLSNGIISSVIDFPLHTLDFIQSHLPLLTFDHSTKIPLTNKYSTPETLGQDRLTAAIAANSLFPNESILVLDAGSCLKHEYIDKGAYYGGSISPGLQMRLKSLHEYTHKLPLIEVDEIVAATGNSTRTSILQGCVGGMLGEMEYWINHYGSHNNNLKVILSGGDAAYFEGKLKKPIFVLPNLILTGLDVILNFNA